MIIDTHGHYTTAPAPLGAWRDLQIAFTKGEGEAPDPAALSISDDEIRETIEANQLRLMNERGSDITVFSPRASFMAHHIGDLAVSETWARICNDLVARVSELFPDRFLPSTRSSSSTRCPRWCTSAPRASRHSYTRPATTT